jgi:cytoskeletal protein CcmA (bactofilin family)
MNESGFLVRLAIGVGLAKRIVPDVRMQSINEAPPTQPAGVAIPPQQRRQAVAQTPSQPKAATPSQPLSPEAPPASQPQRPIQSLETQRQTEAAKSSPQIEDGVPARASDRDIGTVIPAAATLSGDLHIEESIVLECVVRGNVTQEGDHQVVLRASGGIHGTLRAKTAVIGGEVEGDVFADRILVLETGVIHGDIEYTTIAMREGATVNGVLRRIVPNLVGTNEGASAATLRAVPNENERVA